MQIRIKKIILLSGLIFILLVSAAYSIKILGFEELRFDGALSINSTTLSIKTNNLVRMFVNTAGLVGINTSTPSDTLTVNGTMNIRPLGTSALFVQSDGNVGIGNTIPNNTLDVSGNANISGILSTSGINVSGTIQATTFIGDGGSLTGLATSNIIASCFEDDSIDITDDTTFCDASLPSNVTSVYWNNSWKVTCCTPQSQCSKDISLTLTDETTVCDKVVNYSVTNVFYDSGWKAKCCTTAGTCFDDNSISATDITTTCDAGSNSDLVSVTYGISWEVICCDK